MEEWINQLLDSPGISFSVFAASLLLGIIGSFTSCCNYAILGAVAGYSAALGAGKKGGLIWLNAFSFMAGVIISFTAIGALTGYLSEVIGELTGAWWQISAGILLILFGLIALNLIPFKITSFSLNKERKLNIVSALVFGLVTGGLSVAGNACCNPVFPIILSASFLKGSVIWGILLLISFGIGFGLPMFLAIVGIGFGTGKISEKFSKISVLIRYLAGGALIITGFYLIFST